MKIVYTELNGLINHVEKLELVSKELNHFGVIAGLFRQIGVIVVDLCYFALFEDFHYKNNFFLPS